MSVDIELEDWKDQWRADAVPIPDLKRKALRQGLQVRLVLAGEILLCLIFTAAAGLGLWFEPVIEVFVLAVAIWVFSLTALLFSVWNRRGTWDPLSENAMAFVTLSIRRTRMRLRGIAFGLWLFVIELPFIVAWDYVYLSQRDAGLSVIAFLMSPILALCLLPCAGMLLFFGWYRRRNMRELAAMERLRTDLEA